MTPVASLRAAPLGVGRVLAELLPGRARRLRRAWVGHDRAHIEVRGAHREGTEPFARRLEDALGRVEGVHWAEVNAVLGRVVVAFDGEQIDVDDLVDIVEGVEEAHELHEEAFPAERPEHPGDAEPLHRQVASLAADALGLGLSSIGRALGRGPLTEEVASLLSLVDSTPRLREQAERRLGTATADLLLATANAVSQGIAQGPLGLLVDATHRLAQVGEITARRVVWHAREPELHGQPSDERTAPLSLAPRPVPMPAGPVERYGDRAAAAAMLGAATTWIATRNHNDAVAALVSGTPKAARLTREVFASTLGRLLWRRGIVPLDATALRRLDRVDTVVVDAPVLMTGRAAVGAIEPTGEAVERLDDLRGHAAALLDPHDPHAVRRAGGWVLGPLPEVTAAPTPAIRAAARRVRRPGGQVLGLTNGHRLVAVLGTEPELDGLAGELLTAAAGAGTLLVAGEGSGLADRVGASGSLPGGTHLAGAVRELQAQGHVVALVAARGAAALAAADCGIGLLREGFDPPWGADLLCGPGLAQACRILDAAAA
ncbi:MAG TPA: heavy metal translocating P-type ATPase, partial [Actinomycetes bacterium]|nr:heavy metal translocating P-type ATPase [Actinomycetes bacterium]